TRHIEEPSFTLVAVGIHLERAVTGRPQARGRIAVNSTGVTLLSAWICGVYSTGVRIDRVVVTILCAAHAADVLSRATNWSDADLTLAYVRVVSTPVAAIAALEALLVRVPSPHRFQVDV